MVFQPAEETGDGAQGMADDGLAQRGLQRHPGVLGTPDSYWDVGCTDEELYHKAEQAGRVAQDVPVNHSASFAPVIQPTLDTGTEAMVVAALAWLGSD